MRRENSTVVVKSISGRHTAGDDGPGIVLRLYHERSVGQCHAVHDVVLQSGMACVSLVNAARALTGKA